MLARVTVDSLTADSALVEHAGHKYIAVALAADPSGGKWMTRLIRSLDAIIVAPQMAVSDGVSR